VCPGRNDGVASRGIELTGKDAHYGAVVDDNATIRMARVTLRPRVVTIEACDGAGVGDPGRRRSTP
jgi:hypothetical protein